MTQTLLLSLHPLSLTEPLAVFGLACTVQSTVLVLWALPLKRPNQLYKKPHIEVKPDIYRGPLDRSG